VPTPPLGEGLQVLSTLSGCITTTLDRASSQPIGEGTLTYKDAQHGFSNPKTASRRVVATSIALYGGRPHGLPKDRPETSSLSESQAHGR